MSIEAALKSLSNREAEIVRCSLRAAVEGTFFPDWEFELLMGISREKMQRVYDTWTQQSVSHDELCLAFFNSMTNLIGYPPGQERELELYVAGGASSIAEVLHRLAELHIETR